MKEAVLRVLGVYLGLLAKALLAVYRPTIIGITGSVGKTTTKEALYHVLQKNGLSVARTQANLNTPLGISLAILGFDHSPAIWEWPFVFIVMHLNWFLSLLGVRRLAAYWIIEMGVDRVGDMTQLLKVVRPKIGILTWIGEGHHLETLHDPTTIAKEKGQLLAAMPPEGLALIPAEDPQVETLAELAKGTIVRFQGTGHEGMEAIIQAVGDYLKLQPAKVKTALAKFERPKGRLVHLVGINDSLLIDDSYNSSLPAVTLAMETLRHADGKRKIVILGDILEQGKAEARVHQQVADLARQMADQYIAVGKRLKATKADQWYSTPDEAAIAIPKQIQPGDVMLVKGSQGMRMEKISQVLAADKKEAEQKLPRQNHRWQQLPFTNP